MNLKEAFRYQNYLSDMMGQARASICMSAHATKTTKKHLLSKVDPNLADEVEEVVAEHAFYPNDDVIRFMEALVGEKRRLMEAIGKAKASIGFDLDAAIGTNKFRQEIYQAVRDVTERCRPYKKVEKGIGYNFNSEGTQVPYYYDVEIEVTEAFDRENAKRIMKYNITTANDVSAKIDAAMVNTEVDFYPLFDVNDSFNDTVEEFISNLPELG